MSCRNGIAGHGVTVREQQILDAYEGGATLGEIASDLRVSEAHVKWVVTYFNGSWRHNDAFERMVREGSQQLAAAIAATGKVFA